MGERALSGMLVGKILENAAIRHPGHTSFICAPTGRRFTFRETNERCNRLAAGLQSLGLAKGDVIAFLCGNRAEIAEIYFALAKTGIVGIPLNYRLAPAEMAELMRAMGAKGLVYEARFAACRDAVGEALPRIGVYVQIDGGGPDPRAHDYEQLLARGTPAEPQVALDEADPFYFNLTSGTTGLPKSYVLTQFNNAVAMLFGLDFDMTRDDVVLTVFPAFGRVGFAWLLTSVAYGVPNVLANFEPAQTLAAIAEHRVTIVNLVATMAAMLLASPALASADTSSLRAVVFAGSMLPATIRDQSAERLCPNIYEYYGMQETGVLTLSTPQDRLLRADSVGRASLFSDVRVVDFDGKDLPRGEIGEIVGRGPAAVTAYFDNPEKSAETFRNGWIHTGDLGLLDDDGFLFIRGRKKDMIITGGQNVHSAEVEAIVLRHPGVADCAVIGLPDPVWGERVAAVVVPREGVSLEPAALEAHCRRDLAGFKTPKSWFVQTEPLPKTPTGKIQKFLLVQRYGG